MVQVTVFLKFIFEFQKNMKFFILVFCLVLSSVWGYQYPSSSKSKSVYGYGQQYGSGTGRYNTVCSDITSPSRCRSHKCPGIGNVCKWNGQNRCSCQEGTCSDYKSDCEAYSCPYTGNECVYNENSYACSCQPKVQTYTPPKITYIAPEPEYVQLPLPGCQQSTDTNGYVNGELGDFVTYTIPFNYRYLGTNYQKLFLTSKGYIDFVEQTVYFASANPCVSANIGPLIAFFWADIYNAAPPGLVKYKITSDHYDLESAEDYIKRGWPSEYEYLNLTQGVIINYENVAWYGAPIPTNTCPGSLLRNSIQVTLVTNGCREYFIILEYKKINWGGTRGSCPCYGWSGTESGSAIGSVAANFDSGTTVVPISQNSCTAKIVNIDEESNVGVPGYFVFKVGERVISPTPSSDVSVSSLEFQAATAEFESLSEPTPQSTLIRE